MEGKASGGGYIPRGLLGKDGVHRGVFQSIVLGGGGGRSVSDLSCSTYDFYLHCSMWDLVP